jgi:hypothetical protein
MTAVASYDFDRDMEKITSGVLTAAVENYAWYDLECSSLHLEEVVLPDRFADFEEDGRPVTFAVVEEMALPDIHIPECRAQPPRSRDWPSCHDLAVFDLMDAGDESAVPTVENILDYPLSTKLYTIFEDQSIEM